MTDLSKQLEEIKRVWCNGTPDTFSPLDSAGSEEAVATIQRLLHIIEVEIPGMLRARADAHSKEVAPLDKANYAIEATWHAGAAEGVREVASLVENLTEDAP